MVRTAPAKRTRPRSRMDPLKLAKTRIKRKERLVDKARAALRDAEHALGLEMDVLFELLTRDEGVHEQTQ